MKGIHVAPSLGTPRVRERSSSPKVQRRLSRSWLNFRHAPMKQELVFESGGLCFGRPFDRLQKEALCPFTATYAKYCWKCHSMWLTFCSLMESIIFNLQMDNPTHPCGISLSLKSLFCGSLTPLHLICTVLLRWVQLCCLMFVMRRNMRLEPTCI